LAEIDMRLPEQCAQWQEPDGLVRMPLHQADIADSRKSAQAMVWDGVWQRIVTHRCAARRQQSEYAVVLTADSILARSTRRRQTSTGWNTAYIRYTFPPDEKPPAGDALHPMAFLVEKGPGAVTRPHFHQADQFQVAIRCRPIPASSSARRIAPLPALRPCRRRIAVPAIPPPRAGLNPARSGCICRRRR
jgi:hypothetical protein